MSCHIVGNAVIACLSRILSFQARVCPSQSPYGVEFIIIVIVTLLEVIRYNVLFYC
jgi:hypothetical protein